MTQSAVAWEPVTVPRAIGGTGHVARVAMCTRTFDPPQPTCVVAAARRNEGDRASQRQAPRRTLLIYRLSGTTVRLIARNNRVVLRRDEGEQCDAVKDGVAITVKGRSLTLEQGVACGQHWTDYTTVRFDLRARIFIWYNRIYEPWGMNDDPRPEPQSLVPMAEAYDSPILGGQWRWPTPRHAKGFRESSH